MIQVVNINGKDFQYKSEDVWKVQVGRGSKGSYSTRYSFESPQKAVYYFNAINIGRGYKKRLMLSSDEKSVIICRVTS